MIAFWSVVAALTFMAVAFLILPLIRKPKGDDADPARAEFDITVYKDQLKEIERDLDRGVLSEDQALAARTEIERRMLAAQEDESVFEGAAAYTPKYAMLLAVAVLIAVPVGAVSFYLYLGQPEMKDQPLAQRQQQMKDNAHAQAGQDQGNTRERALKLVAQLEQRLKDNPKDIEGWLILAQVYDAMQRYTDSAVAYENVVNLTDRHVEPLMAWAEALIMAEDTLVTQQVVELLKEIKGKDVSEPRSYFYLALERQQKDDLQGALDEYVALLKVSPSDAQWVPQIQDRLKVVAGEMNVSLPVVQLLPPAGPPPGMAAADAPGPTQEQMRDAQQMSEDDQQAMIRSMVQRLADRLQETPDDLAGWQRLAGAYRVLGDMDKAAEAEAQVKRLQGQ